MEIYKTHENEMLKYVDTAAVEMSLFSWQFLMNLLSKESNIYTDTMYIHSISCSISFFSFFRDGWAGIENSFINILPLVAAIPPLLCISVTYFTLTPDGKWSLKRNISS